ncbi:7-carboxy-7-deazaguanine synthase (Cx14CxxC type) [Halospina denitrificans]|uniref:7-carboxy-7-deazaguanine synthase n=1 Tax=Halospina denitrificans TaxID=332522 RepID=A0A4R7K122_9GAMM|nr:7-carboxy-7-deazaguanine synthase [Halospina denitrificans]TDT44126.1 7-carboxy-7-deazaguanine synthase (Cx14CxxC type) [Halospina denitrificans]
MYRVKEVFATLQGEGAQAGRVAVFCRFSKCNLWTGREADRHRAVCQFCDTDFVGTDGQNGGEFETPEALARHVAAFWPGSFSDAENPLVVCTGGEPLLQLDGPMVEAFHAQGLSVAVETNGTLPAPEGIDWLCMSPKAGTTIVIEECDELKLVYPQEGQDPADYDHIRASERFIAPMASPQVISGADAFRDANTRQAIEFCLAHPQWRLSVQMHKMVGID